MPITFLPYMFFSLSTSKSLATSLSASASRGVGELEFFLELLLRLGGIRGDAEDGESGTGELAVIVAESAGLGGAAGGIGARVKEQDNGFTLKRGERDRLSVFVG